MSHHGTSVRRGAKRNWCPQPPVQFRNNTEDAPPTCLNMLTQHDMIRHEITSRRAEWASVLQASAPSQISRHDGVRNSNISTQYLYDLGISCLVSISLSGCVQHSSSDVSRRCLKNTSEYTSSCSQYLICFFWPLHPITSHLPCFFTLRFYCPRVVHPFIHPYLLTVPLLCMLRRSPRSCVARRSNHPSISSRRPGR